MPGKTKHSADDGHTSAGLLFLVRLLLVAAFGIAGYLAYVSLSGGSVAGCGGESDCDKVLQSRWAKWFGVPVGLAALPLYCAMFWGTFRLRPATPLVRQRKAWSLLIPCAVLVIGAALWFTALQLFVIKSLCKFCLTAHAGGFLASTLLLFAAPIRHAPEKPWQLEKQVFIPPRLLKNFAFAALAGLALLVAGQTLYRPRTGIIVSLPEAKPIKTNPPAMAKTPPLLISQTNPVPTNPVPIPSPPTQVVAQTSAPLAPILTAPTNPPPAPATGAGAQANSASTNGMKRPMLIYGGMFALDVHELPLIGPSNAPQVMVSLFDYTCHHCRIMHGRLLELQRKFSNDLAIINLPMPLDAKCNQTMMRTPAAHTNACDFARLGLAVWRANRVRSAEFDEWIFAPETPPPLDQAREHAAQLVSRAALDRAVQDPWVANQVKQDVAIYETAYRAGYGSMPQFIIGQKLTAGTMEVADMLPVILDQLGLRPK